MTLDISGLSTAQLEALLRAAQKEKKRKQKRKPVAKVRALLDKAAKASGYTLAELFGTASPSTTRKSFRSSKGTGQKTTGTKVPPKYRNPADASQTWTGRGKQPRWVVDAIAAGATLDSLRIAPAADAAN